ncbi:MAG: type III-A CRISPR-associated protein Cas10/Csm1, partial [Thermoplasmata archaeon]
MEEMEKNIMRHKIYLAGLLHDIGKFWQRADNVDNAFDSNLVSEHIKNLARSEDLGKLGKNGFPIYGHVMYTGTFLEKYEKELKDIYFKSEKREDQNNFVNLSIYHHNPKTWLQSVIQIADHWASGMERVERNEDKPEIPKDYRDRICENIFDFINNSNNQKRRYYLSPLNIASSLFLKEEEKYDYRKLWDRFIKEWDDIIKSKKINNFEYFVETILYLLKKYAWCIPATTRGENFHDVNLYEHSRMVAAIAVCIYDWFLENKTERNNGLVSQESGSNSDGPGGTDVSYAYADEGGGKSHAGTKLKISGKDYPVLMVCVDVVGIQDFIFNIVETKASRNLKAKSLYVQLLSETVVYELLSRTGLTYGQVIYVGGGKAYLLLPNTTKVRESISDYRKELERWLLKEHEMDLYVSIDYIAFRYENNLYFVEGKEEGITLGEMWNDLIEKVSGWKYRRFSSLEDDEFNRIFDPFGLGGGNMISDLSGRELQERNVRRFDDLMVSEEELNLLEFARGFHNARYLLFSENEENIRLFSKHIIPVLRIHNSFWGVSDETGSSFDNGRIFHLIKDGEVILSNIGGNSVKGFRFYGGLNVPVNPNEDRIRTFEELCESEEYKKIGILRMDVDNLGKMFQNGFGVNANFARLSTLSFAMDWFFSGYVNH